MNLFYDKETITLRREEYLELLKAQDEAKRIIQERRIEIEENRERYNYTKGKALFITKDGLAAVGMLGIPKPIVFYRRVERKSLSCLDLEDFPRDYSANKIRNYKWDGQFHNGMPVYHEV